MGPVTTTPDSRAERVRAALDQRLGSVVAVLESVRRRHNSGAILRSAEAFGVHDVHLITGFQSSPGAARGAERWVRQHRHRTTEDCFAALRAQGFRIYVADLQADAWTPETLPIDAPFAVLFGSEMRGVSPEAKAAADGAIIVPMRGLTHSLNVSVSAAIILRTVTERRRALVGPDLDPAEKERFYEEWLAEEAASEQGLQARQHLSE